MKQLRLVGYVFALSAWAASFALAGDGAKCTSAASGTAACASGAKCTPEMKAACARAGMSCDKASGTKATAATAGGTCQMHGTTTAAAGSTCQMHGASAAGKCEMGAAGSHADCAVCADQSSCDEDVRATGAHTQVVALKNGAMIVYTTETPEGVRALQAAVARHNATVVASLNGKRDGQLCGECKGLRGAMASGKFTREIINVQHGVQVILTSNDRATIQRIRNMTGAQVAARVKG